MTRTNPAVRSIAGSRRIERNTLLSALHRGFPLLPWEIMAAIGVLTMELRIETAHSLKDKRHVVKSLKEKLRNRHNISIAEVDYQDQWQHALLAAVTVSSSRQFAEQVLQAVEAEAYGLVGEMLTSVNLEWVD